MPQWLEIYLAFALAGGLVTYLTVVRVVTADMKEITDKESAWMQRPILHFVVWIAISLVTAPFILAIVLRGDLPKLRQSILARWLENAGHND